MSSRGSFRILLSSRKGPCTSVYARQRHGRDLKQRHKILYYNLLTIGKLNAHLTEIDRQAEGLFFRLVNQMAEREGVTERLKAENQMEWVRQMNSIRNRVSEIVYAKIIFSL